MSLAVVPAPYKPEFDVRERVYEASAEVEPGHQANLMFGIRQKMFTGVFNAEWIDVVRVEHIFKPMMIDIDKGVARGFDVDFLFVGKESQWEAEYVEYGEDRVLRSMPASMFCSGGPAIGPFRDIVFPETSLILQVSNKSSEKRTFTARIIGYEAICLNPRNPDPQTPVTVPCIRCGEKIIITGLPTPHRCSHGSECTALLSCSDCRAKHFPKEF